MKVSYLCANTYADPEVVNQASFPYPPRMYDREMGARSAQTALEHARLADDLGFDWVSVSEHHYAPGIMQPNAIVFASALTQVVKRAKIALLGPTVSINNPVRIAEEIAMVDQLSGGRVIMFLLRGTPNEFNTYYINALETRERAQEAIKLIEYALTEPQPFGWEGRYFRFPTVAVWPRCIQVPHPPLFSSGNSPESCVFAARNRHGLAMSFIPPHLVAEAVKLYKTESAMAGWEPRPDQILYRSFAAIAETEREAEQQRQARMSRPRARPEHNPAPSGLRALSWLEHDRSAASGGGNARHVEDGAARASEGYGLGSLQFQGTPDMIVEQVARFQEQTGVGVLDLIFSNEGGPDGLARCIRLFGEEVLPRVRHIGEPTAASSAGAPRA